MSTPTIRRLHTVDAAQLDQLADVLIDCVEGGASVSFMLPLTRDRALAFWRRVADDTAAGRRALLIAEDSHGICGTVQLILDQPETPRRQHRRPGVDRPEKFPVGKAGEVSPGSVDIPPPSF